MSKILVTGGAGYIGSHVVLALLDAGHEVVTLDDLSTGTRESVAAEASFWPGDAGDPDVLDHILRFRDIAAVVHLAGSSIVPESVARPLFYWRNNAAKSQVLIERAARAGVGAFVFSSTAAVYGEPLQVPIAESAATTPINPYGRSKLAVEWMLEDAHAAHGLPCASLRYFNVAGADPLGRSGENRARASHLINVAAETATGSRAGLKIFGTDYPTPDGTCVRDYVHVSDLAAAHVAAVEALLADGGRMTLNCGYGRGFSVREVVEAAGRAAGKPLDVEEAPRRPGDPARLVSDASLIRQRLDWRPRHDDLDAIISHALAWERSLLETGRKRTPTC